jgi:hypothetical protein
MSLFVFFPPSPLCLFPEHSSFPEKQEKQGSCKTKTKKRFRDDGLKIATSIKKKLKKKGIEEIENKILTPVAA